MHLLRRLGKTIEVIQRHRHKLKPKQCLTAGKVFLPLRNLSWVCALTSYDGSRRQTT